MAPFDFSPEANPSVKAKSSEWNEKIISEINYAINISNSDVDIFYNSYKKIPLHGLTGTKGKALIDEANPVFLETSPVKFSKFQGKDLVEIENKAYLMQRIPNDQLRDIRLRLEAAAKIIELKGWIRNAIVDSQGRVCALGAMGKVDYSANHETAGLFVRYLRKSGQAYKFFHKEQNESVLYKETHLDNLRPQTLVAFWNDEVATGSDEVVRELRAAARFTGY